MTIENSYGITNGLNPGTAYPIAARLSQQVVDWAKADGHQNFRFQLDIGYMWRVQSDTTGGAGWDFAPLDDAMAKLTAAGMTITFPIRGMPDWALVNPTYQATDEAWFMPDPEYVLIACQVIAARYDGIFNIPGYGPMKLHKMEIGNEEYNIHFTKFTDAVTLAQAVNSGTPYATVNISASPIDVPSGVWMQFGTSGGAGDIVKLTHKIAVGDIVVNIAATGGGTYTATRTAANNSAWTAVYHGSRVGSNAIYDGHLGVFSTGSPPPQPARDWWFLQQVLNRVGPVMRANFPTLRIGAGAIWWMWDDNFTDFIVGLGSAIQWVEYVNFHFYSNGNDPHTGSGHSPSITTAITNVHNALIAAGFPNTPIECTEFGWQVPNDCTETQQATNYSNFLKDAKATGWLRRVYLFTYSDAQSAGTGASLYVWNGSSFDERAALPVLRSFIVANPHLISVPQLSTTPTTLSFTAPTGGSATVSQSSTLAETAGIATAWTSTIRYGTGGVGGWLTVSLRSGSLAAFGSHVQTYTCAPGTLVPGAYTATVTYTATTGGATATVTITFVVSSGTLDSPYGCTVHVGTNKSAISDELLMQCAKFTNGGTTPFWIRYQYSWSLVETSQGTYGGLGPLDETVDKVNAIPGLRLMWHAAYAPSWWLRLDKNGVDVGSYGGAGAVIADGPAYAQFCADMSARYGDRIHAYQVGDEEFDTQMHDGGILAKVFNYAAPQIRANVSTAFVGPGAVRKIVPGGPHVSGFVNKFFQYAPGSGEPAQALPDFFDAHYYRDTSSFLKGGNNAPDPTTTDYSENPSLAYNLAIQDECDLIGGILATYSPATQLWVCENGYDIPTVHTPNTQLATYVELSSQQSRSIRSTLAQMQRRGASKWMGFTLGSASSSKTMTRETMTDLSGYSGAVPQWGTGTTAPSDYLYTSTDTLYFEGTPTTTDVDQYFAITNPTSGSHAWTITSNKPWLTAVTLATNGVAGTHNKGLTTGTLASGQSLSFACSVDSTLNGLATLTQLTGILTITIGGVTSTITVTLWITPVDAAPTLTVDTKAITVTTVYGSGNPGSVTATFTNTDKYRSWWWGFTTGTWLTIPTNSGILAAGGNLAVPISLDVTSLPPGTYQENVVVSLDPHPTPYSSAAPPAHPAYTMCVVTLVIAATASASPSLALSTGTLLYAATSGDPLPASQTVAIRNCTKAAKDWTTSIFYGGGATNWLTLTGASGTALPASGTNSGSGFNVQSTDYTLMTVAVNTTALSVGTYTATLTTTLGSGGTPQSLVVTYTVTSSVPPTEIIACAPTTLSLSQVQGGAAITGNLILTNTGNTSGTWTETITYDASGSGYISTAPITGPLTASGGIAPVVVTLTPGALSPGTYTGLITFTLGSTTATCAITFIVTSISTQIITVSPSTLALSAMAGSAPSSFPLALTNTGTNPGTWTEAVTYDASGSGWITISPITGTIAANGGTGSASVTLTPGVLTAGTYTALITFSMGGSHSTVSVTMTLTPVGVPLASIQPGNLTFTALVGDTNIQPQTLTLSNTGTVPGTWSERITYDANGQNWLTPSLVSGLLAAGASVPVLLYVTDIGLSINNLIDTNAPTLAVGTYQATITFTMGTSVAAASIQFVVNPLPPPPTPTPTPTPIVNPPVKFGIGTFQSLSGGIPYAEGNQSQFAGVYHPYAGQYGGSYGFLLDTRIRAPQATVYTPALEVGLDSTGLSVVRGFPQITWTYTTLRPDYYYYLKFLYWQAARNTTPPYQYLVLIQYPDTSGLNNPVQVLARMDPPTHANRDVAAFYGVSLRFTFVGQTVLLPGTPIVIV